MGGWPIIGGNNATSWLHLTSWNLPDFQLAENPRWSQVWQLVNSTKTITTIIGIAHIDATHLLQINLSILQGLYKECDNRWDE